MKNLRFFLNLFPSGEGISYKVKKCLRHFMKNLRFFLNLFPSGEGISYMVKKCLPGDMPSYSNSGDKSPAGQRRLGDGIKGYCARLVVRSIPMSFLRQKSCSALASTILESPLHRTKATCTISFDAIPQAPLPRRAFVTRIL